LCAGYLCAGYLCAGYLCAGYLCAGYLCAGYLCAGCIGVCGVRELHCRAWLAQGLAQAHHHAVVHVLFAKGHHGVDIPHKGLQRKHQPSFLAPRHPVVTAQTRRKPRVAVVVLPRSVSGQRGVAHVAHGARKEFVLQAQLLGIQHGQHGADTNRLAVLAAVLPAKDTRASLAITADDAQPIVLHWPWLAEQINSKLKPEQIKGISKFGKI